MATADARRPGRRATVIAIGVLVLVAGMIFAVAHGRSEPPTRDDARPDRVVDVPSDGRHTFSNLAELVDASDLVVSGRVVAAEPGRIFGSGDAAIRSRVLTVRVDAVLAGARGNAARPGTVVLVEEEAELVDGTPVRVDGMRAGRIGDDGIWFLAASGDRDFPGYAVVNSQGRFLVGADGSLEGGDASDALVQVLEVLDRAELAGEVRAAG